MIIQGEYEFLVFFFVRSLDMQELVSLEQTFSMGTMASLYTHPSQLSAVNENKQSVIPEQWPLMASGAPRTVLSGLRHESR